MSVRLRPPERVDRDAGRSGRTLTARPATVRRALRATAVAGGCALLFAGFFGPVVFGGRYLTDGGDGLTLALPAFLRAPTLWEPNIMLGYPWSANLGGFWDPLALVLRALPNSFNLYMLAAYVIAAGGAYALAVRLTGSHLGGAVSAVAYALGGFMLSHLGHYDIVHPGAWAPWVMCAFAALRERIDVRWVGGGAVAIAACLLGGGPQIFAYTLVLGAAYVITGGGSWKYAGACAVAVGAGVGLAAISLVPGFELARDSVRATLSFDAFVSFSNPPREIPVRMFFPYFLGVTSSPAYPFSAVDADAWSELSNYTGITTLVLAAVAAFARRREPAVRFWLAVAVIALVLSAGDGLGAARLTYHVPGVNLFRAQGRHAFEFSLAAAVLAAYGVAAIEQRIARRAHVVAAIGGVGLALIGTMAAIAAFDGPFAAQMSAATGGRPFPLDPLRNPALGIPCLVYLGGAAAIWWWSIRPTAAAAFVLFTGVLVDLASFAWFGPWHAARVSAANLAPPAYVAGLRRTLERTRERVLPLGSGGASGGIAPDLNLLWQLPVASGRVQLEAARTAALLRMDQDGIISPRLFDDARDRALDLAAIRYLVLPADSLGRRPAAAPFDAGELGVRIGSPAWTTTSWVPGDTFAVRFAAPLWATRVVLVSSLSDGATFGDRTRAADLVLTTDRGQRVLPLLAGRDTAERGFDRPNVRPAVRHARAVVFADLGIDHEYLATLDLGRRERLRGIALRWSAADPRHGYLNVDKLSLIDDPANVAYPLAPLMFFETATDHWRRLTTRAPAVILENRQPLGRAWIVHRVRATGAAGALAAIRAGRFDPRTTALAEDAPNLADAAGRGEAVHISALAAERMTLDVRCATRCFVVTSDAGDPGWVGTIDDAPDPVYRADYALRGAFVPAGSHRLTFSYQPRSLVAGAAISAATALLLLVMIARGIRVEASATEPERRAAASTEVLRTDSD